MGYWPSKICCLLNIVIMVGYGLIDCIIGGQLLSAVSNGSLTVIVGIVIVALISWSSLCLALQSFMSMRGPFLPNAPDKIQY